MGQTTKQQLTAALQIAVAVADSIRELGTVPSGHLYAALMGRMSLETYQGMIGTLKCAGLVEETAAHELRWIGPAQEGGAQ